MFISIHKGFTFINPAHVSFMRQKVDFTDYLEILEIHLVSKEILTFRYDTAEAAQNDMQKIMTAKTECSL